MATGDTQPSPPSCAPRAGNRWLAETGGTRGPDYARRFAALAESGADVHGEARFVDALLPRGSRVVDAGCGTGRVAAELARAGHQVVGIDLDASMVSVARGAAPELAWVQADLLDVPADRVAGLLGTGEPGDAGPGGRGGPADAVVAAGNVMVYLTEGTEPDVVAHLSTWLAPGGLLVAGFAADRHVTVADYRRWCTDAGLAQVAAFAGWDREPLDDTDAPYAVLVHRR